MKLTVKFDNAQREQTTPVPATQTGGAARNLALAHKLTDLIERGLIADYTAAARLIGVSQPRLTHLMSLTLLCPQIQEALLFGTTSFGDKHLRVLARIAEWTAQLRAVAEARTR